MELKRIIILMSLIAGLIEIVACGPTTMSDNEFVSEADSICNELFLQVSNQENDSLSSDPYRKTANDIGGFNLSEDTAPNAIQLRTGLSEYAEAADQLNEAIGKALIEGNITPEIQWMLFENGSVMYYPIDEGILGIKKLDIDSSFGQNLLNAKEKINTAAGELGLETCMIGEKK